MILELDNLRALPSDTGDSINVCAVYFLWLDGELLYIGQSACLENRIFSHERRRDGYQSGVQIPFDSFTFIAVSPDAIDETETAYIRAYWPKYNKTAAGGFKRARSGA